MYLDIDMCSTAVDYTGALRFEVDGSTAQVTHRSATANFVAHAELMQGPLGES